ncbi:MAG: RNA 2',3'-cyclic phosphodiesterase [Deltaproteobacteria bacterium]|mgnify:CR=1 FL=1|nr:MAG: RNA 2',3'-cyclic phosphodiesterase [Deltaproteobacteria bacterium]
MRVFIAALIPEDTKLEIKRYVDEVKRCWDGVKWEDPKKFHITLKFLGEIEEARVEDIKGVLSEVVGAYSPFNVTASGLGGFPDLRRPRVIFVDLLENKEFESFQRDIEEGLTRAGFKREERPFVSHITVGRVKGRAVLRSALPTMRPLSFSISEVAVMRSILKKEGSVYTPLFVFRLS